MKIDIKKTRRKTNNYKMRYAKDINFVNFKELEETLSKKNTPLFSYNPEDKMNEFSSK